jgi:hypothetical protein
MTAVKVGQGENSAYVVRAEQDRMWALFFVDYRDAEGNVLEGGKFLQCHLAIVQAMVSGCLEDVVRLVGEQLGHVRNGEAVFEDPNFYAEAYKWDCHLWSTIYGFEHDGSDLLLELWDAWASWCSGDGLETYVTTLSVISNEAKKYLTVSGS